jgi:acetyltransferase-like isoleucine patch superfamily enzyme
MRKLRSFLQKPFQNKINSLYQTWRMLFGVVYYRLVFGSFGSGSILFPPTLISNTQHIRIGKDVLIRSGGRLEVVFSSTTRQPELRIGNNVNIEQNVHITCHNRVTIGSDVTLAPMCSITDITHPFDGVGDIKVGNLLLDDDAVVEIGDGTWIGIGAVILPNVRIGKRCVIGANAVVTKDIPDGSVAIGSPARVVRSIT